MNHYKRAYWSYALLTILWSLGFSYPALSCTIVSAVAKDGTVWTANNEDGPQGVANFINVFPKNDNSRYGYFTLSYLSPELGKGGNIQGGMNEAGLTFDFNTINPIEDNRVDQLKAFPGGDEAILPYILANMRTVDEVVDFFSTYWFTSGFRSAQMHVADRQGKFAIISASGIKSADKGQPLVSTNFDICANQEDASCWRYPLANRLLTESEPSLQSMLRICRETAQGEGTLYSNIQNLTTGEIWFFSKHDPGQMVNTTIHDLLAKGQQSYSFSDLNSLVEERPNTLYSQPEPIVLTPEKLSSYAGSYHNDFIGEVFVRPADDHITLVFADGREEYFYPESASRFFLIDAPVRLEFGAGTTGEATRLNLYENNFWIFEAKRND